MKSMRLKDFYFSTPVTSVSLSPCLYVCVFVCLNVGTYTPPLMWRSEVNLEWDQVTLLSLHCICPASSSEAPRDFPSPCGSAGVAACCVACSALQEGCGNSSSGLHSCVPDDTLTHWAVSPSSPSFFLWLDTGTHPAGFELSMSWGWP